VDSAYYGANTLEKLVNMTGNNCRWGVYSLLSHTYSARGTRFLLDSRELKNHPILLRGLKAGTIGYDRLPNIHIFDCYLNSVPGHTMAIYLTLTGVGRVRRTNFLCHEELCIVNAALNIAAQSMKVSNPETLYRDNPDKFPKFETKVKGDFKRYQVGNSHKFGPETMKVFSEKFDAALGAVLSNSDDDIVAFMDINMYSGMRHEAGDGLCPKKLKLALATFKRGYHFTASLAGIKGVFKEQPEFTKQFGSHNSLEWDDYIFEATDKAYDFLKLKMFSNALLGEKDIYHFDLGLEVTPIFTGKKSYLVNMKYAKTRMEEIFDDKRSKCAYSYTEDTAIFDPSSNLSNCDTQSLETTLFVADDQHIFDTGEPLPTDEIDDEYNMYDADILPDDDSEYFPEDEYDREETEITSRDLFFESKKLGVNTYEKCLSNGNIGGVHSGNPLIRFKENSDDLDEINAEREIFSCLTKMILEQWPML
jgi:hypothetical protein